MAQVKAKAKRRRTRISEDDRNQQEIREEKKADGAQVMREVDEMYQHELLMADAMVGHTPTYEDAPCIADLMLEPCSQEKTEINFKASIARRECVCRMLAKHYLAKADDFAEFLRPKTLEDIYGKDGDDKESEAADA